MGEVDLFPRLFLHLFVEKSQHYQPKVSDNHYVDNFYVLFPFWFFREEKLWDQIDCCFFVFSCCRSGKSLWHWVCLLIQRVFWNSFSWWNLTNLFCPLLVCLWVLNFYHWISVGCFYYFNLVSLTVENPFKFNLFDVKWDSYLCTLLLPIQDLLLCIIFGCFFNLTTVGFCSFFVLEVEELHHLSFHMIFANFNILNL